MREPSYDPYAQRRTVIRAVLFFVIVGTLPFYVLGFVLWGTAPQANAENQTQEPLPTNTPIGQGATATNTLFPTFTPRPTRTTQPLGPTPGQFIPPVIPTVVIPTSTPFVFPTSTPAPSLTPFPSSTPLPTNTPLPSATPLPTNSPVPSPTPLPPPTDTPAAPTGGDPPPGSSGPGTGGGEAPPGSGDPTATPSNPEPPPAGDPPPGSSGT
ncbi:MAG: hypothetical protein ACOCX3_01075 [Chloroflexota bacterium]